MRTVLGRIMTAGAAVALAIAASLAGGATSAHAATSQGHVGVQPNSHSGCNDDVCITVNGTGLHVNYIFTSGHNTHSYTVCSTPYYTVNGVQHSGSNRCIASGNTSSITWNVNKNYANNTEICVGWTGISGFPCATVHS